MTPEQISAMVSGGGGSGGGNFAPLSTYTAGISQSNPYYQPIVDTWNSSQSLGNWGANPSPEAISAGTNAVGDSRNKLAQLMAQGLAWRAPQAQQSMGMYNPAQTPGNPAYIGGNYQGRVTTGYNPANPYGGSFLYQGGTWSGGRGGSHGGSKD